MFLDAVEKKKCRYHSKKESPRTNPDPDTRGCCKARPQVQLCGYERPTTWNYPQMINKEHRMEARRGSMHIGQVDCSNKIVVLDEVLEDDCNILMA